jgi:glycosyltransferase involved in cell wall biosynthesis
MKILFLTSKVPWPLHDGYSLHNYHYSRQLGARHEIHLISLGEGPCPAELKGIYASTQFVPRRPEPRRRSLASRAIHALSADEVHDFDPAVMDLIERTLQGKRFDLIWVGGAKMLVYSRRIANVPALGDIADDGVKDHWTQMWTSRSPATFVRRWRDYDSTRRFQLAFLPHCSVVNVVTEEDRASLLQQLPSLDVSVIHNGVDAEYFESREAEADVPTLVFEGSMDFTPNAEAAMYFCGEVLPLVREHEPRVRTIVVGKGPSPEVKALGRPDVEITGFVPDVRPFLDKAWVFVCPLLSGAGIKNKILQAWSMKKAVVATSISTGGLVDAGENLIVADGKRAFAAAILQLFADQRQRRELGERGRATVVQHYSWESKARQLEAALSRAAGQRPPVRTPASARTD